MKKLTLRSSKNRKPTRVGRGIAAGRGKTAGRGTKGQKSRSGFNIPNRYEGGQTNLSMRLPKLLGFNRKKADVTIITLDQISKHYKDDEIVSISSLVEKKLISKRDKVKVLNTGSLAVKVGLDNVPVSKKAKACFVISCEKDSKNTKKSVNKSKGKIVKA